MVVSGVRGGDLGPETSEPGSVLAPGRGTRERVLGLRVPLAVRPVLDTGWWGQGCECTAHIGEGLGRHVEWGWTELLRGWRGGSGGGPAKGRKEAAGRPMGLQPVPLPCLSCPTWASGPAHSCWGWHLRGGRVASGATRQGPPQPLLPVPTPLLLKGPRPAPPTMTWQKELLIWLASDWGPHACVSTWVVGGGRLTTQTPVRFSHPVGGASGSAFWKEGPRPPSKPHLGSLCVPRRRFPYQDNSLTTPL